MKSTLILMLSLSALLCMSCSKKHETPAPQTNAPEAAPVAEAAPVVEAAPAVEAPKAATNVNDVKTGKIRCGKDEYDAETVKGWICLNGAMRCLDKNGCKYGDQTAQLRSVLIGNTVKKADEAQMNVSMCEPTRMLPGTTCKDDKVYCGDAVFPGDSFDDWRCLQNQWLCVAESCVCGRQKTGKFGTCKDGVAYCGDKEMTAPKDNGYICQSAKWVCADPEGCGKCDQYQSLGDKGKCEGKSHKIVVKHVACEEGNCPCGDGACPKGGACLTITGKAPICTCGNYQSEHGCVFEVERPIYSNKYGEFTCDSCTDGGTSQRDMMWYIRCENEKGCHIQGEKGIWKPSLQFEWEYGCYYDAFETIWNEPEKYHLVESDGYNDALSEAALGKCGRKTALEFKQTCANENCKREQIIDSCTVRTACDTMPVPRADRGNFSCDFLPGEPYHCKSWIDVDWEPAGLRCNSDSGCTCHHEICAKGQLCVDGVCRYDTVYANEVCENIFPHLAPDEASRTEYEKGFNEDTLDGVLHIYSPSDSKFDEFGGYSIEIDPEKCHDSGAYDVIDKMILWENYSTNVVNKLVTPNGTCLCGFSEYTPKNLSQYRCVQSLGYVCTSKQGCDCGDAQCKQGALCLREGQCSSVVMDKGLTMKGLGEDPVETWCEEYLRW